MAEREKELSESIVQLKDITTTLLALRETPYKEGGHTRHIERASLGKRGELRLSVESLTTEDGPDTCLIEDTHPIHRDTLLANAEIRILSTGHTIPVREIPMQNGEAIALVKPK